MDEKMKKQIIKSESELSDRFIKNYKKLGYSGILKCNKKRFPDFIMIKNNKNLKYLICLFTNNIGFLQHLNIYSLEILK